MSAAVIIFGVVILLALDEVLCAGLAHLSQYEQDFDR